MRNKYTEGFLMLLLLHTITLIGYGQRSNPITYVQDGRDNKIEFRSADNRLVKTIDIKSINPYVTSLPGAKRVSENRYEINSADKLTVLKSFFIGSRYSADDFDKLDAVEMTVSSDVLVTEKHVIVANHLTLHGQEGGVLGVRSSASVYNAEGVKISNLHENNDGYFAPTATADGKYLATLIGDITVDVDFTLLPSHGFRIYDLKSGAKLFEQGESTEFSILPPGTWDNVIVMVLRHRGGKYEYNVINVSQRTISKRMFTREEVPQIVDIDREGVTMEQSGRKTRLLYTKEFNNLSF